MDNNTSIINGEASVALLGLHRAGQQGTGVGATINKLFLKILYIQLTF
jgi:hypothetical protein